MGGDDGDARRRRRREDRLGHANGRESSCGMRTLAEEVARGEGGSRGGRGRSRRAAGRSISTPRARALPKSFSEQRPRAHAVRRRIASRASTSAYERAPRAQPRGDARRREAAAAGRRRQTSGTTPMGTRRDLGAAERRRAARRRRAFFLAGTRRRRGPTFVPRREVWSPRWRTSRERAARELLLTPASRHAPAAEPRRGAARVRRAGGSGGRGGGCRAASREGGGGRGREGGRSGAGESRGARSRRE